MGHKPWDRAWRRADKARERNAAKAEMWGDMETITLDDMRAWRQATVNHQLDDLIAELGLTQAEIEAAD